MNNQEDRLIVYIHELLCGVVMLKTIQWSSERSERNVELFYNIDGGWTSIRSKAKTKQL